MFIFDVCALLKTYFESYLYTLLDGSMIVLLFTQILMSAHQRYLTTAIKMLRAQTHKETTRVSAQEDSLEMDLVVTVSANKE